MSKMLSGLAALLCLAAVARGEGKLELTVKETAGIRRFGYPVYAKLALPRDATEKDRFRLLAGGKPVAAQFRLLKDESKSVALDFTLSCSPLSKTDYTVEYGEKVEAGPEPKGGIKLEQEKGVYTIRSGGMVYVVDPAHAWLRSVHGGKKEFVRPGAEVKEADRPTITVVREGPVAISLRVSEKGKTPSTIDYTFPRSKSWVEIEWSGEPPSESRHLSLPLTLSGKTALADFGAGSVVYTTLTQGQQASMSANDRSKQRWEVSTGNARYMSPFVVPAPGSSTLAEGWAHVMDNDRCTAIAVDGFGRGVRDTIQIKGSGELQMWRHWPKGKGKQVWRFWLHFVDMPVQIGALTSPQSMMSPLVVEVK